MLLSKTSRPHFSSAASVSMLIKVWMLMKRYKGVYLKLHFRLKRWRYTVSWYYSPPNIPNRYGLHLCILKMPNDCLYGSKINVIKIYHVVVILKLKSDGKIECLSKICHLCDYHETSLELIWCQGICNHRHDVGRAVPHKFGGLLIILHTKKWFVFEQAIFECGQWASDLLNFLLLTDSSSHDNALQDSKVHGANMGPIWGRQDLGGPHVGPMNFAIWAMYSSVQAYYKDIQELHGAIGVVTATNVSMILTAYRGWYQGTLKCKMPLVNICFETISCRIHSCVITATR